MSREVKNIYEVEIMGMVQEIVKVEASSKEEAINKVELMLNEKQIPIDRSDIFDIQSEHYERIEPAKNLPEGWIWHMYADGSGGLSFNNKDYFLYSMYTQEYKFPYMENATWGSFKGVDIDLINMAETHIIDNVLNKDALFEKNTNYSVVDSTSINYGVNNMEERNIGIYLTNLSEYTKGNMLGEWVRLPCSREKLEDVFKYLKLDNGESECFITDYDVPMKDMYQNLGEFENLDELNFLAARLADMSVAEYEKYTAIVESGISTYSSAEEYLNLTYNLNKFNYISVKDEHELGEYLCQDIISELPTVQGVDLSMYIDYERIGSDYVINMGGQFCKSGYVEQLDYTEELFFHVPDAFKVLPSEENVTSKTIISDVESNNQTRFYDEMER